MADDVDIPVVSTATIATDEVAGRHFQLVKLTDSTDGSTDPTGVADNPLTVESRLAFVDYDESIVPVSDSGDEPHYLPVVVRNNVNVAIASSGQVPVVGLVSDFVLTGPSDDIWVSGVDLGGAQPGMWMLTVRSTGGTPTVAAFAAAEFGGTYDQQLPLVVPSGDSLVLADTFTAGAGARFCYILAGPAFLEIRAVSGGTSDPVDATLTVNAFQPPIVATVSSGGASGDTELTTKDYDSGGGTDTVAVTGILLPASGGAVAGGTSTDPLRTDPTGTTAQPVTDGGGSITVDGSVTVSGTATVSGSVTANAGTNLNTSALATESGGNLAAAAASLSVLDDWDETDRAKVNPIVGQAGVQGASGAVSATTQRVVLATDVALPAGTNAIGKLSANSGVDIGDVDVTSVSGTVTVGGVAATDAAVSGNPVLAAGRASTAIPTAMSADGDVVPIWLDRNGALVTTPRFGATSTLSNVNASATSVTLLSSNTSRRSATIVNDSASICRVKEGATASATSYSWLLQAYDTLVLDGSHSGTVDAIWDTATGAARITERT